MAQVGFIGLGTMGFPMAGHLAAAGHRVKVYNRTPQKAADWLAKHPGHLAPTPAEAAQGAEFVCICVGNDDDLRSVVLGSEGVLAGLSQGGLLIDHTTASAQVARELFAQAQAQGCGFLDAPVSGGQAGAEQGTLSIMVGGEKEDFARAEALMTAYARSQKHLGASGAGQLAKMVNQICIGGLLQGLAEAVHFVECAGLEGEAVFDVIQHGAAGSWQLTHRHQSMLEKRFDFGFAVDWMRKDLGLVLEEARRNGASLPITALVDQFYADVQALGGGRWDTSSLVKRLEPKR
ncbi:NAD(P)-dependent oxidoreductase [Nitrincola tapanii]|uniref:NAD(P)-dependent oxidoreductase n=1 Tax=Nitrincola tapanii TaxID=1708751 RepID=A0A5A9W416_9GAMM|nr:NAD(P)-dependent oxidoreductase [Nitrincola tapanii]KAA0875520.1 NAD(P)-dependent oxidoreductase [Nitrincola tapanii]